MNGKPARRGDFRDNFDLGESAGFQIQAEEVNAFAIAAPSRVSADIRENGMTRIGYGHRSRCARKELTARHLFAEPGDKLAMDAVARAELRVKGRHQMFSLFDHDRSALVFG